MPNYPDKVPIVIDRNANALLDQKVAEEKIAGVNKSPEERRKISKSRIVSDLIRKTFGKPQPVKPK